MRPINEIIVHCTATRADWWAKSATKDKVAEVRRWHMDRGWKDIGYHFLIDRNGTLALGRPIDQVGAHTQGHNTGTIGVSLFGGFDSAATDKFSANFTPEQDKGLRQLIKELTARYKIRTVSGHNQYAAKACPGFNVSTWFGQNKELLK